MDDEKVKLTCPVFFYLSNKSGDDYKKKIKVEVEIEKGLTLEKSKKSVCEFAGLHEVAEAENIPSPHKVNFAKIYKNSNGKTDAVQINTDAQWELAKDSIFRGESKLQVTIAQIMVNFGPPSGKIVIEGSGQSTSKITKDACRDELDLTSINQELPGNSKVIKGLEKTIRIKGKIISWPYYIICGICSKELLLRVDGEMKGRINYFKKHHYDLCKRKNDKSTGSTKQKSIMEAFKSVDNSQNRKRKRVDSDAEGDNVAVVLDSDLEQSSGEELENSFEATYDSEIENPSPADSENSKSSLFKTESDESSAYDDYEIHTDSDFDYDDFIQHNSVENPDPVCQKLDELIRRGLINRNDIFYKYLNDFVEIHLNPIHAYSDEVIDFFNTIAYLGGERTVNMIRGPMFVGQGRKACHNMADCQKNLCGPSEYTRRKRQSGYTVESGVLKPLLETFHSLSDKKREYLIDNDIVQVIPVVLANDGNPLKPGIKYDQRLKRNVGLDVRCDENFIKDNAAPPDPNWLRSHFVTEVLISYITSLDDKDSLPIATDYVSKVGKSADEMKSFFIDKIKIIQICKNCLRLVKSSEHIITEYSICSSFCPNCYENETVCEECEKIHQTSHIPALRACTNCLNSNLKCCKLIVTVLVVDCETGNKGAMLQLKDDILQKEIDPELIMLSVIPDPPHLGKSLKASFANWFLLFVDEMSGTERGNLSLLYTLRNNSDIETMSKMRSMLKKNDYVRNKDRQDPMAVLALTQPELISFLKKVGPVVHTIIPETIRYTEDNKSGMYPNPISVSLFTPGKILFMTYNANEKKSTLYSARLHYPVDKITVIQKNEAKFVSFAQDLIFMVGYQTSITFIDTGKKIHIVPSQITKKKDLIDVLLKFNLPINGTVSILRDRLFVHVENVEKQYKVLGYSQNSINFWILEKQPSFEAFCCADKDSMYAACSNNRYLCSLTLSYDGVGIKGDLDILYSYDSLWNKVSNLCLSGTYLYVLHNNGITKFTISNFTIVGEIEVSAYHASAYHDGLVFSNPEGHCISYISNKNLYVESLIGDGTEGNLDGIANKSKLFQPCGITVEHDNIIYFSDIRVSTLKMYTPLKLTGEFLQNIGKVYEAFSMHPKGKKKNLMSLPEATQTISSAKNCFEARRKLLATTLNITTSLNGPDGSISNASMEALKLLEWGLKNLLKNLSDFEFGDISLESSTTLEVEHFHATVHYKESSLTPLDYARSFGKTMNESLKKQTKGSFNYFTSAKSWYPVQHEIREYRDVKKIEPLRPINISQEKEMKLRDFAATYGRPVRQKTNRQQTTMANAGTLPDYCYRKPLVPSTKIDLENLEYEKEIEETEEISENERSEYETNSSCSSTDDEGTDSSVDPSTFFMVGRTSRAGRTVKMNSKFFI